MTMLATLRSYVREHGWLALFRKIIRVSVYRKDVELMFVKDLTTGKQRFGRGPNRARVLRFPDDFDALRRSTSTRARAFCRWSREGVVVVGVVVDDAVVAVQAYATGTYREPQLNFTFELRPGDWLMFGGWVHPDWRGTAAAVEVFDTGLAELAARGGTRAVTLTKKTNLQAQKFIVHSGFYEPGTMFIIRRLLSFTWTITRDYSGSQVLPDAQRRRRHHDVSAT